MFGLFNKKSYKHSVTKEDKNWIEENFTWLIECFGLDRLNKQPFILPVNDNFPYTDLNDNVQFQKFFEQICAYLNIHPGIIKIDFFDDIKSKQWTNWTPQGNFSEPAGFTSLINTGKDKFYKVELAQSNLKHPQLLVAVLANELTYVKLLESEMINRNEHDIDAFINLSCIFFGFGIFMANSVLTSDINWMSRSGILPNEIISYSNALICYITNNEADKFSQYLNDNTKELFKKDYEFLFQTNDTLLIKEAVLHSESVYKINEQINDGYNQKDYSKVLEQSKILLEMDSKSMIALCNIAYSLQQQKNYAEAIKYYNRAIDIDPYFDYPYVNRGYCKLQIGDINNAYADIFHSFEMNPYNPYAWRNKGAYYLKLNELKDALHHFEKALEIDPKTELINAYLGHTYLKLGKNEIAQIYLSKAEELGEQLDS